MGSSGGSATLRAEEVVRRFYDFLARGRLVDALNLFTTDARLRDASGRGRRDPGNHFLALDVSSAAGHRSRTDGAGGRGDSRHRSIAERAIRRPVLRRPGTDQVPPNGTGVAS